MSRLSRRTFLQGAALAGSSLLLPGRSKSSDAGVRDVLVIGAGMAGLTAARELARAGVDVHVLEARKRVGGRIFSLSEPAKHGLELGAQRIHGTEASTWSLIREFDLKTRPAPDSTPWNWVDGKGFEKRDTKRDDELFRKVAEAHAQHVGDDMSYFRFVRSMDLTSEEKTILLETGGTVGPRDLSAMEAIVDGAAWNAYRDRDYQVIGGYSTLPERLAGELGDRIQLSSPVQSIEWKRGEVRASYKRAGKTETIRARRALVTLPVSVLQSGQPTFSPALPDPTRKAIDSLIMGQVAVVHLLFDDWFWRDRLPALSGWGTERGDVWFADPHPEGVGMPALEGWITGRAALELSDAGSKAGTRRVLGWIEQAFPGARERLEWSHLKEWTRDPYTQGSYSHTLPGGYGQRRALATPIEESLYFAGEATASAHHWATVHGAHSSGLRASREILASLGVDTGA
jgi:monoamine oxidase